MATQLLIVPSGTSALARVSTLQRHLGVRSEVICLAALDDAAGPARATIVIGVTEKLSEGLDLLAKLRARAPDAQILMLSEDDAVATGVSLLKHGADAWLPTDSEPVLIASYVAVFIRRAVLQASEAGSKPTLNRAKCTLRWGSHEAALNAAEFRVLDYLMSNPGRWISAEELRKRALHINHQTSDSLVRVYVCGIRRTLGPHRACLRSKWRAGYRFDVGAAAEAVS